MGSGKSTAAVVSVAALVGVVLGNAAGAAGNASNTGASALPAPPAPLATPAAGAAPSAPSVPSHDDSEPEEPHGGSSDNPYDDGNAGHAAIAKQSVQSRDGMLRIPGGRFTMGSSSAHAPANERPAHAVVLPAFWIDRTEVTVGAYRACVDAGTCPKPARTSPTCTFDAGDPELPVSCVHWRDADAYCHFAGKRLPAEAEWEYAARGPYATTYPWGTLASCANAVTLVVDQSANPCQPRPARVGTHPGGASVWGVLDMSGNVEEWTADWYVESLGPGPAPRSGSAHVLRGGGWLSMPTLSRTTTRDWGSALEAGPNVGFRCAKNAE
jgi:formylglycine-generating enzyme required for sulfatase activity